MPELSQSLRGQVVLLSGGSTELAAGLALALARQGMRLALAGRGADLLELAAAPIRAAGGACLALVSELDTPESAAAVLDATLAAYGRVDVLIMVSPFWGGGLIHEHNVRTWDLVLNANLREPFLLARAVLPVLRAQKSGQIMAVGSDSGLGIYPQDGAYAVALHGLNTLLELIRAENSEFGIRVHSLGPGLTVTDEFDMAGQPNLLAAHVADWVVFLLTRPPHLRANGPILI